MNSVFINYFITITLNSKHWNLQQVPFFEESSWDHCLHHCKWKLLTYYRITEFRGVSIFGVVITSIRAWLNNDKLVNFYCGITVKGAHDPLKAFTSDSLPHFDSSLNADTIWQLLSGIKMCLSITSSSIFDPSKEYVCSMKNMQICGLRWMWLSDASYNLSDMLFQWRIWGGPHETFIWEEWLRRDIDENRDDRKREHNSKKDTDEYL